MQRRCTSCHTREKMARQIGNWVRTRYTSETVDVIAGVALERGAIAYVPVYEFGEQITMCIRFDPPRNGQKKSVRLLSDFGFNKIISI